MLRSLTGICLLLVCAMTLLAAEYKGKIKSVDRGKNTITITVEDKDVTLPVSEDVKVSRGDKELKKKLQSKAFDKNRYVTVTTQGDGDKEVVKEIRIGRKDQ
jgi:hypothetical protein